MDVGNKMLLAMGWVPGEPLGIRGRGILDPVEIEFRHDRDYRGLGFEEFKIEEDEEVIVLRPGKITNIGNIVIDVDRV